MSSRALLGGGAVILASLVFFASYLHRFFAVQVNNREITAEERRRAHASGWLECLPSDFIERPQDFRTIHVLDEKSDLISLPSDEDDAAKLFTKLLRRNMICFFSTPQSWILRVLAMTPKQKQSFSKAHIEALDFQKGDLCCGFNRVLKRDPLKVEIDVVPPEGMGAFFARLVIGVRRSGENIALSTHTIQWTKDSAVVLPLERGIANFMHETASWWLIVSGLQYLESIALG